MVEPETKFQLEASGGVIDVSAICKNGKVTRVNLTSMPSFVAFRGKKVSFQQRYSLALIDKLSFPSHS